MKNSKYIKVSVSDRKPDRSGDFLTNMGWLYFNPDTKEWGFHYPSPLPEYWLQEVPDYEDEMKEMLDRIQDLDILPQEIEDELSLLLKKLKS